MGGRAAEAFKNFFCFSLDYFNFFAVSILGLPLLLSFLTVLIFFVQSFSVYFFFFIYTSYLIFFIFLKLKGEASAESLTFSWVDNSDQFSIGFTLVEDAYTLEFSILLVFLGLIIQWYSYFYFKKDPDLSRFSILLGFFLAFMLLMVNTGSWVFMFIAWEGVGLFSFLLVSFWYSKVSTFKSGMKVLFYNRLGDFFFFIIIGFILFFLKADSMWGGAPISELLGPLRITEETDLAVYSLLNFALFLVILSKSAQFGFHIWLLEAMEAPLPASSLIHSATLVCAGVVFFFKIPGLLLNLGGISAVLVLWSSLTAALLSISAIFNYDIKKILAYSTGSHVSIMLALCFSSGGSLGYIYTLLHASTKVFIFLLFGFIIDLNLGVRDLRKMGGFFNFEQLTFFAIFAVLGVSSLPLAPLAVVKDNLIVLVLDGSYYGDLSSTLLMFSSFANYVYMYRLFFKIFFGDRLAALPTYFKIFFEAAAARVVCLKQSDIFFKIQPLILLFLYIVFLESLVTFFFYVDYGFVENRIVDMLNCRVTNTSLYYLAYTNSFFFLVIFGRVLFSVFK